MLAMSEIYIAGIILIVTNKRDAILVSSLRNETKNFSSLILKNEQNLKNFGPENYGQSIIVLLAIA